MTNTKALILRIAIPTIFDTLLDYCPPETIDFDELNVGVRVLAPFGARKEVGILVEICHETAIEKTKLRKVIKIIDEKPLFAKKDIQLLHWIAHYYFYPIGNVFCKTLPTLLKKGQAARLDIETFYLLNEKGRELDINNSTIKLTSAQQSFLQKLQQEGEANSETLKISSKSWRITINSLFKKGLLIIEERDVLTSPIENNQQESKLNLNPQQQQAVDKLTSALGEFKVFLLEGVTGSGKTEVYMQLIAKVLEKNLQVMVLLPEITLTPQLESRFRRRFSVPIVISHSKLTDKQRLDSWLAMQTGKASILLGTRSALFTPLKNIGLIILDEEHDSSFKQQEGLRFSARDVAVMRAKLWNVPIVLGTATPSLETLANVEKKRYQRLYLDKRAGEAKEPKLILLDIRNKRMQQGLSVALLGHITETLAKNEQILIFLNRRGFAPTLICHSCSWVARCQRCDANLVIHQQKQQLRCHHCGDQYQLIHQCPACQKNQLSPLGMGTERVEQFLLNTFSDKKIVRLDAETTQRKGQLEEFLAQINRGDADIILGTQMLAKGHHFPNVTLVALLDIDSGLFSLDFRAPEKLAQLITQVSGRAGRGEKLGKVILQTHQPEHPLLNTLIKQGYKQFAKNALVERKAALLPPYSYQALLRVQAFDEATPHAFFTALKPLTEKYNQGSVLVLGAVAAPMAKREGRYRFQLLFQSEQRMVLQHFLRQLMPELAGLKEAAKVRWSIDVDPIDLY